MKNYQESDYALNKFSPNIVYHFADGKVEITLKDYLESNPGKTEQDFAKLKALSDEIYHEQVIATNRTSRLDVTMNGLEETEQLATVPIDIELIHKADGQAATRAANELLKSGNLTEVQRRRFILHFFQGLSTRQIGHQENVSNIAIHKSIQLAKEKLKTFFEK